jgi:hypothetical protein
MLHLKHVSSYPRTPVPILSCQNIDQQHTKVCVSVNCLRALSAVTWLAVSLYCVPGWISTNTSRFSVYTLELEVLYTKEFKRLTARDRIYYACGWQNTYSKKKIMSLTMGPSIGVLKDNILQYLKKCMEYLDWSNYIECS